MLGGEEEAGARAAPFVVAMPDSGLFLDHGIPGFGHLLTVGVGFASGTEVQSKTTTTQTVEVDGAEVMTAGAKYVSGDITFAVGYVDGEAKDTTSLGSAGSKTDTYESTAASVTYSVASGVSAILGYSDQDRGDESSATANNSGSAWYVGALVSF